MKIMTMIIMKIIMMNEDNESNEEMKNDNVRK